jgi:hypothetical protein
MGWEGCVPAPVGLTLKWIHIRCGKENEVRSCFPLSSSRESTFKYALQAAKNNVNELGVADAGI